MIHVPVVLQGHLSTLIDELRSKQGVALVQRTLQGFDKISSASRYIVRCK
jgi:hypothetical protein